MEGGGNGRYGTGRHRLSGTSQRKGGTQLAKYAEMIRKLVLDSQKHLTAEEIFAELKKTCPSIVLATVYNNLNRLTDEGKLRRICMEDSPDRYDRPARHDHLLCRSCGALADITLQDLTQALERQVDGEILSYDLMIHYICPKCRKKA